MYICVCGVLNEMSLIAFGIEYLSPNGWHCLGVLGGVALLKEQSIHWCILCLLSLM